MFAFFIVAGIVTYSTVTMTEDIINRGTSLEQNQKAIFDQRVSLSIDQSYYDSERLKLLIRNSGQEKILFKNKMEDCFDVYINGEYINHENYNFYISNPQGNYYVLLPGEEATFDIKSLINENQETTEIIVITCNGVKKNYKITNQLFNWYDDTYKRRSIFTITNPLGPNQADAYFPIKLNNSNFDFTKGTEDNIIFMLPTKENLVLDLNFDNYKQTLDEHSRYNNTVYLGLNAITTLDDPKKEDTIFFKGLNFDGINDTLHILQDSSLRLDKRITISTWAKWKESGNTEQIIYYNGLASNKLSIINDGGANHKKILFSLDIGGAQTLYSNATLDSNWHHIVGTYNGSEMRIYIDNQLSNKLSVTGDISNALSDNYIGSNGIARYFNGTLDEFKLYNIGLNQTDISDLYLGKPRYKQLNFTVQDWNTVTDEANLSIRIPYIRDDENISVELYYYIYGDDFSTQEAPTPPPDNKPGAIADLSASPGNKEAYLTWSEPTDGGSPITSYTIKYGTVSSGLFNYTYNDDTNPNATITGLANEVEWQFRVYATNANGDGPNSNVATTTPNGFYYFTQDTTTNLGFDGTANQGTTPVAYAQLLPLTQSPSASACIGVRVRKTGAYEYAYEYTPTLPTQTEFEANAIGQLNVYSTSTAVVTWTANIYQYNDATGNVGGIIGTATNTSSTISNINITMNFNNTAFNISAGNRIKVQITLDNGNNNIFDYLCYGTGTQSFFTFNKN